MDLTYFKLNGKWYCDGSYNTKEKSLLAIWREVRELIYRGKPPGLIEFPVGREFEFNTLVDVPRHEHRHLYMIMAHTLRAEISVDLEKYHPLTIPSTENFR